MKEYFFKFNPLAKYVPDLIADTRASMKKFMKSVSSLVLKECRTAMLNRDIDLPILMIHAQQIEADKIRERDRPSSASTPTPRNRKEQGNRSSMSRSQNSASNRSHYPPCAKYGRYHLDECLADHRGCFDYGKLGHKLTECPHARQGNRDDRPQTQATNAPALVARPAPAQGVSSSNVGG
ncbi:uncharacterized protein LOC124890555 [Capsicum annuum]|uniref:uncharacterized protein LOC124890555 n=1 Tax=Capsicum annuum TaxID=4072 RepID=UPI001FB0E0C9|nr:uncharacterized protein LOC124890555 [Capsicum annuum]